MKKKEESTGRDKDEDIIRQKWPGMPAAERRKYIVSYYKIPIVVVIVAVIAVIFLIRDISKDEPEDAFSVMVLDMEISEDVLEETEQELSESLGLDSGTFRCRIEAGYSGNRNMQSEATVAAYMRSGQVDVLIAPEEEFNRYAATGYLASLKECGLEGLVEEYRTEDLLYAEAVDYSEGGAVRDIPCRPHKITADSECYGIYLKDAVFGGYVAGVMVNAPNQERIRTGMEYFLDTFALEIQ